EEAQILEPERPVERDLNGSERHSYRLTLKPDQYVRILVEQRGIDLVLTLLDHDGKIITESNGDDSNQGTESASLIAHTAGDYRVEVRSHEKTAPAGRYGVKIAELHAATEQDRQRVTVERTLMEGARLRAEGTAESSRRAIKRFEEALPLQQGLGDRAGEANSLNKIGLLYSSLSEKRRALEYYNRALPMTRALDDRSSEA